MKVKLKSRHELQAVYSVVAAMAATLAEEATRPAADGERPHVRMACRLVALEVHKQALAIAMKLATPATAMKLATPATAYGIRINAHAGLALLSAWYALDATEISDPLAYALISEIMDNLERAYGGQIVNTKSKIRN